MASYFQSQVKAQVLGIMQDGGLPHIGCRCRHCLPVYEGDAQAQYAACLVVIDERKSQPKVWLIDATPDVKYQLDQLADLLGPHDSRPGRLRQPDGIFLTHAHFGHIGGLPQLGPEAMAVQKQVIYGAPALIAMLSQTRLWGPLMRNLELIPLTADVALSLAPDLTITPVTVPHRDEWGVGTFAFRIQGPEQSLLYLPDIDAWEEWPQAQEHLASVDVALVDACFYSADELGGRPPPAHPFVPHTLDLWASSPCRLVLTHINHTNPILNEGSEERAAVVSAGAEIARTGQQFAL